MRNALTLVILLLAASWLGRPVAAPEPVPVVALFDGCCQWLLLRGDEFVLPYYGTHPTRGRWRRDGEVWIFVAPERTFRALGSLERGLDFHAGMLKLFEPMRVPEAKLDLAWRGQLKTGLGPYW